MRKVFSVILLLVLIVGMTACGKNNGIGGEKYGDVLYEGVIPDFIAPEETVSFFVDQCRQYNLGKYENITYTEFRYSGNFETMEQADGNMEVFFSGKKTDSLLNQPYKMIAVYTKADRKIKFYAQSDSKEVQAVTTQLTSERYNELVQTMKRYMENLGISSGYIELVEYPLEGYWIATHSVEEGRGIDVTMKIDSISLDLLEYK